jgi:hypothetical protein
VKDVQRDIAAESSPKLSDDASSTEDEDIRLVVEDSSDETDTETQEAQTPEINTEDREKLPDNSDEGNREPIIASADELMEMITAKPPEKEVLSGPSSPIASGIFLDKITSNFEEVSCTSFDKSLEEIDPKKTEDKNETPMDDVPAEKTPDEAVKIEPEVAKVNSNDEVTAMEVNEVEEKKYQTVAGKIDIGLKAKFIFTIKPFPRTNKKEINQ